MTHGNEDLVSQQIQLEAPKSGVVLMRNNTGAMQDVTGRVVRYGLMNASSEQNSKIKSSDFIGITPIIITPDMVGKTIGVFTAIEVKASNWSFKPTDTRACAQKNFIDWVVSLGGIAGFCTSVDSFRALIER